MASGPEQFRDKGIVPFWMRKEKKGPEQELYNDALKTIRAWHVREGRDRSIIDFDLTDGPSEDVAMVTSFTLDLPTRHERSKIINALSELLKRAEDTPPPNGSERHNWEFFKEQIGASYWFARRLADPHMNPYLFIEKTMCISPEMTPESYLERWREKVFNLFGALGIKDTSQRAMEAFKKANVLNREQAESLLEENIRGALTEVVVFTRERIGNADFDIRDVDVKKYFWVWADTDPKTRGFVLRQNFSQARQKTWTPGKAEELGFHEGGAHLGRMARRRELIRRGKLHTFFGLTTLHGPEPVVDEGLAQTLVYFIPGAYELLSPEGKFQVDASILRSLVYGNVHLMINNPREPFKPNKVIKYVQQFMPWETKDEILEEIHERTKNPLYQTYRFAYAAGARIMLQIAANLNNRGKREFLKEIYSRPYTISQATRFFNRLMGDERNISSDKPKRDRDNHSAEEPDGKRAGFASSP